MSFKDFFKKSLMNFFIIVGSLCFVIGILGLIYEPERTFGYEAYFSPIIFGAIGSIPSIVTYSKEELTLKQMIFRKILQLVILECLILLSAYFFGIIKVDIIISLGLSVIFVFLIVHFIAWIIDWKTAGKLNENLKAFQNK